MKEKAGIKKEVTAYAYCLQVLVPCLLSNVFLLLVTIFIILYYGESVKTIQVHIGIIFMFIVNLEVLCPLLIVYKLVSPLKQLNQASEKLAVGDFDVNLTYTGNVRELNTLFRNFDNMTHDLASIETLRTDFVSNVSHEFKTPLTSIEGYATLLQNPDMPQMERDDCTNHILYNTKRLSLLVGNILMLNKLENQRIELNITTYRLDEQIRQILVQQEAAWDEKEIEFDIDLQELNYTGVEQLLYHVWSNLISNAVKYSSKHGVIQINLIHADNSIVFTIRDYGIGIKKEDLSHIFEKFYQADTTHKTEGNGLGLSQVKKILEIIGGQINVESTIGKGSTFVVYLK